VGQPDKSQPPAPSATSNQPPTIEHLLPRRDSTGGVPSRFQWTPIAGADRYALGVWNEADVLVWRQDHVREASIAVPAELQLEPGTYFWSVTALREGRPVAESGLAAFVVLK